MKAPTFVNGSDLVSWAARLDAQSNLPLLLRRLVHGSIHPIRRIGFPAGEGVQHGGWDGIVVVDKGNAFVPDGTSAWELSTRRDVREKANEDYKKRSQNPLGIVTVESTFVFVTPRRWDGKKSWEAEQKHGKVWKDIRVYDADDLEQWLELAPAVHLWFSKRLGKHPEHALDLESFWNAWSIETRPIITPELILSGRQGIVASIRSWLKDPQAPLVVQGDSPDEALAVFAAALQVLPLDEKVGFLSRAVLVRDAAAWGELIDLKEPLILVKDFASSEGLGTAMHASHAVVIPLGRSMGSSPSAFTLPPLARDGVESMLIKSGFSDEDAFDLSTLARRSFTAFRRKIAIVPELQKPAWAEPSQAGPLVPLMLAGSWSDSRSGDQAALTSLANLPYEDVERTVARWSSEPDPPVSRVDNISLVISREDAFSVMTHAITKSDLARFEKVTLDVLGTPDPRYDLPEKDRWMAEALGHASQYSPFLYEGIAEMLAILGSKGNGALPSAGISPSQYVAGVVSKLLDRANADWRIWASLSTVLPLLAEAEPDAFLSAVEKGLTGTQPVLAQLFIEPDDGLFSSSPHTGLLWALETLAWSPDHFGRSVLLLAKLARLDPGGKLLNRPKNSLREIFLLWHPQTSANLESRLNVIDSLTKREPEIAWDLLRSLLPKITGDSGGNTPKPKWRDWGSALSARVSEAEYAKGTREVYQRMLLNVGTNGVRWRHLIEALPAILPDQFEAAVKRLQDLSKEQIGVADRSMIWGALRELIANHRSFPDAHWALSPALLDHLELLLPKFKPQDDVTLFGWLFTDRPDLPGDRGDWNSYQREIAKARLEACKTIHDRGGVPGLLALVPLVQRSGLLGFALGESDLLKDEEDDILQEWFISDSDFRKQFARGLMLGRVSSQTRAWLESKLVSLEKTLKPAQRVEFLLSMPCDRQTWDLANASGPEVEKLYWSRFYSYEKVNPDQIDEVVRKLLAAENPEGALVFLGFNANQNAALIPELITDAFEAVLCSEQRSAIWNTHFVHDVPRLLNIIETSDEIEKSRVARIEWGLVQILGRHNLKPKVLHQYFAQEPAFFVQVLASVYRAQGEEDRNPTDEESARARNAYELLKTWSTIPGSLDNGNIEAAALKSWVKQARELTAAAGRGPVGDSAIGELLSNSPHGADGVWPHEAVREIIEEVVSEELEDGFRTGTFNSRGTVVKSLTEGGAQERKLSERYTGFAAATKDQWPRAAASLRRIAKRYDDQARREDDRVELR